MMTMQAKQIRPLAPLIKRRRIISAMLLGLAVMVCATVLRSAGSLTGAWWTGIWGVGLGMSFAAYMTLMLPHGLGLPTLKDRHLDERQKHLLLQTYTQAYRVVGIVVLLGMFYLYVASDGTLPMPATRDQWLLLFWSVILLVGAAPNALLAWKEPDYLEDAE